MFCSFGTAFAFSCKVLIPITILLPEQDSSEQSNAEPSPGISKSQGFTSIQKTSLRPKNNHCSKKERLTHTKIWESQQPICTSLQYKYIPVNIAIFKTCNNVDLYIIILQVSTNRAEFVLEQPAVKCQRKEPASSLVSDWSSSVYEMSMVQQRHLAAKTHYRR